MDGRGIPVPSVIFISLYGYDEPSEYSGAGNLSLGEKRKVGVNTHMRKSDRSPFYIDR